MLGNHVIIRLADDVYHAQRAHVSIQVALSKLTLFVCLLGLLDYASSKFFITFLIVIAFHLDGKFGHGDSRASLVNHVIFQAASIFLNAMHRETAHDVFTVILRCVSCHGDRILCVDAVSVGFVIDIFTQ